jgi:nucleotidyltransferase substrate binding protein (TIGR01987 family)
MIDISPLERATAQLTKSLHYCDSPLAAQDLDLYEQFRAATVQAFEFSFELAWKMMKRYLEEEMGETEADRWPRKELFRHGAEIGLIADPATWFDYMKGRNLTSHAYNENYAEQVLAVARAFLPEALCLCQVLRQRLGGP